MSFSTATIAFKFAMLTVMINWTVATIVVEKATMPGAFTKAKKETAIVSAPKIPEAKVPEAEAIMTKVPETKVIVKVTDVVHGVLAKDNKVLEKDPKKVAAIAAVEDKEVLIKNNKKVAAPGTFKAVKAIKDKVVLTDKKSVAPVDAAMATKAIKEEKVEQKDLKKVVDTVDNGLKTENMASATQKASAIKEASAKAQDCSEVKNLLSIQDAANTRAAADAVREAEHKAKRDQELARLKRMDALGKAAATSCNLDRFAAQLEAAKQRFEANKAQKKLVVLRDHQSKTFARWAKRAAREAKEEEVKSTIKAMQLRIAALEEQVRALRAREVQAASEEKKEEVKVEETPREEKSELVKDVVKPAVGAQGPDVFTTGEEKVEVAEELVVAVADVEEEEAGEEEQAREEEVLQEEEQEVEQTAFAVLTAEEVEESQEAQVGLPSAAIQPMEGVALLEEDVSMEEIAGDRQEEVAGDYGMEGQESYTYQVTIESSSVAPTISVQLPVTPYKTPENALVIDLPVVWREVAQYDDELVESDDASTYGEDEEMDFIPEQDEENLEELVHAVEGLGLYEADIVMQPTVESSFAPEYDMQALHEDVPVEQEDILAILAVVALEAAREEQQATQQQDEEVDRQAQEAAWIDFLTALESLDVEQIPDNNTDIPQVGDVGLDVDAQEPESTTIQPWEIFTLEDHMAFVAEAERQAAAEPQREQVWEGENLLFNNEVDYRESDEFSGSDAEAEGETDSEYMPVQEEERGQGGYPSEDEDDTRSDGSSEDVVGRDADGEQDDESPSVGDSDSEEDEEEEEERAQEEPVERAFVRHAEQYQVVDDDVDERVREAPIAPRQDREVRPLRRRQQRIDPEVLRMEAEAAPADAFVHEELQIRARYEIAKMRDQQDGVYDSDTDGEWDEVFADNDADIAMQAELSALRARRGGENS